MAGSTLWIYKMVFILQTNFVHVLVYETQKLKSSSLGAIWLFMAEGDVQSNPGPKPMLIPSILEL